VDGHLVNDIDAALREAGSPERAAHDQVYLKSNLVYYRSAMLAFLKPLRRGEGDSRGPCVRVEADVFARRR
jgi:hypothetical protein